MHELYKKLRHLLLLHCFVCAFGFVWSRQTKLQHDASKPMGPKPDELPELLTSHAAFTGKQRPVALSDGLPLPERDDPRIAESVVRVRAKNFQGQIVLTHPPFGPCFKDTKVLIFVPIQAEAYEWREQIRNTWATKLPRGARRLFVVGKSISEDINTQLMKERFERADLLLTDVTEGPGINTTLKILAAYRWGLHFCSTADFIMKVDSLTVVVLDRLMFWLKHKFVNYAGQKAIFGSVRTDVGPSRDPNNPMYVSVEDYPDALFPAYTDGYVNLYTTSALRAILKETSKFSVLRRDDVFVNGILAKSASVELVQSEEHFRIFGSISHPERCETDVSGAKAPVLIAKVFTDQPNMRRTLGWLEDLQCEDVKKPKLVNVEDGGGAASGAGGYITDEMLAIEETTPTTTTSTTETTTTTTTIAFNPETTENETERDFKEQNSTEVKKN